MKKLYLIILGLAIQFTVFAQCATGFTEFKLNWDYLDFMTYGATYSPYISLADAQTQYFAFGKQKVKITNNYAADKMGGELTENNSVEGADVKFIGNGIVRFDFDNPVSNVKFTIADIDRSQVVRVTALNIMASQNINMTRSAGGASILSITNNNTATATATASGTNVANNSNLGSVDIVISSAITSFTITVSNTSTNGQEDGSFYISDVSACTAGTFATDYYNISKPFTNQPAYIIAVRNDSFYYVDIANGKSKYLFADYGHNRINSTAYDPYRHMVYYTYSLSGPNGTVNANSFTLRRYDYEMDTLGIIVDDVRTLGVAVFSQGVESGGAAYYDGALYLGIEGVNSGSVSESIIWRINFDAQFKPIFPAVQVFGIPTNNHDWSDFGINNGVLYDFDGKSSNLDFFHKNLLTGTTINYAPTNGLTPRQTGVDWTGKLYNVGSANAISAATIVPYNNNGSVDNSKLYDISFNGSLPVGSWGDAAEAFKPKTDFGDAPASYDPISGDPATHEVVSDLYLGETVGIEFSKKTSTDATGDGPEEDGIGPIQTIKTGISNHLLNVKVFNNTGANATLAGWIDKNNDGVFTAGEGVVVTVPSSPTQQIIPLTWVNINIGLPIGTKTFLRLRLTSAVNNLTTAKPTGYMPDGEVEDYVIIVTIVLPDQKLNLTATKIIDQKVNLVWKTAEEADFKLYQIQKSKDALQWNNFYQTSPHGFNNIATYSHIDNEPFSPINYYRVQVQKQSGEQLYSNVVKIDNSVQSSMQITPNPASKDARLLVNTATATKGQLTIIDYTGKVVYTASVQLNARNTVLQLPIIQTFSNGVYRIRLTTNHETLVTTMIKVP